MLQRFLKSTKKSQQLTALIIVLIVAGIGTYLLTNSHAATPYASSQADTGTLTDGAIKQTCAGASDGNCVVFSGSTTGGSGQGKLLGLNSSLSDPSELGNSAVYQQLHVNSLRGDIELDTSDPSSTTFQDPTYSGTTSQWINTLTSQKIVPLPLLNEYIEMSTLLSPSYSNSAGTPNFVTATVNWCKTYCMGGSYYTSSQGDNGQSNPAYAPQVLEILNEPYYGVSYGYPVTPTDVAAYGTLLKDIRSALNNAGLSNIGILAGANNNSGGTANWDSQLVSNGGFAAAQGVTIHPYGPVDTVCTPASSTSSCTLGASNDGTAPSVSTTKTTDDTTNASGLGQLYYIHKFLNDNGLSNQANNVYITEDGWCNTSITDPGCSGGQYAETQKDQNITTIINQLATVSWFKGFWYFNLIPYQDCYEGQCAYNTYGFYTPSPTLAVTPAWGDFQAAAQANGL